MFFVLFLIHILFTLQTTVGIDYSGIDIGIKQRSRGFNGFKKCILEVTQDGFKTTKGLKVNTIYCPIEMLENKSIVMNQNMLESSQEGLMDGIRIKGFETQMDLVSINSLLVDTFLKDFNFNNLVVSVRDYYNEEDLKMLSKVFSLRTGSSVTIIPASLAFIVNNKLGLEKIEDCSIIVSTKGNKVSLTAYKIVKEQEKCKIENVHKEVYEEVCDNKIRNIMFKSIQRQVLRHLKSNSFDFNVTFYPLIDEIDESSDKMLDLLQVYEDIKNSVLSKHFGYTIREVFIEDIKEGVRPIPIHDVFIDIQEILKEIDEQLEQHRTKFENVVQQFKELLVEKGMSVSSVYFITDFFEIFKVFFDLDEASKVHNTFITDGLCAFDKSKIDLVGVQINETFVMREGNHVKLYDEISQKKKAKATVKDIHDKGGLDKILPSLEEEKYSELNEIIQKTTTFDLKTSKKINHDFNLLTRENQKVERGRKERETKKKALEKMLIKTFELEKSEPELWATGLDKKAISTKEWFETSKDNLNVLGDDFEGKQNLLEGFVEAYRKSLQKKKEEEKVNEPIEFKPEDFDKETLPDMKDFDFKDFQNKFDDLMKDEKYKKIFEEKEKKKNEEQNQETNSREL